jgi:hypothetical protein
VASLIDELVLVLEREDACYTELIKLSREKSPVIVKGDLEGLAAVTVKAQEIVGVIQKLEKDRISGMKDIAEVTGRKADELKLTELIDLMKGRPEEQKKLSSIHDRLSETMRQMTAINEQNRNLLKTSLDMVEFEINLLQSMKQAPETADYNKNAYSTGAIMGSGTKRFDTKQ